jgi:hypothetical protein
MTRRRALVLVVAIVVATASAAEAGVLQRAVGAFTGLLSPASPKATRVIAAAGRRFSGELQTMARELPHKVTGSAPELRLGAARQVSTLTTPSGQVTWDAALDRGGRGFCQVAVRRDVSLGGDCQVTDRRGYALSIATSGDTPDRAIVTGLVPTSARDVMVTLPSNEPVRAEKIGRFFFAAVAEGSPLTVTVRAGDGHVLRLATFTDPVCIDGVDARGQRLSAGLGFTYCGDGGVLGRFPADPALAPLCSSSGCGVPTTRINEQPGTAPATAEASSPVALLRRLRENLHTNLIEDARLEAPPAGYGRGGRWLFIRVARSHGSERMFADFYALLLAGAYAREAPLDKLPPLGGLVYYDGRSQGCATSPTATACNGVAWRAHLQAGAGAGTTDASQIRLGLARAGLVPVTIRFAKPLDSLVPIVVARAKQLGRIDLPSLPDEVFGPESGLEGTYLEIVDNRGHPMAAQAMESYLGIGITWSRRAGRT